MKGDEGDENNVVFGETTVRWGGELEPIGMERREINVIFCAGSAKKPAALPKNDVISSEEVKKKTLGQI